MVHWSLETRPLHSLEMLGNKHPVTKCNITEEWSSQLLSSSTSQDIALNFMEGTTLKLKN